MRYFDALLLAVLACLAIAIAVIGFSVDEIEDIAGKNAADIQALKSWDQTRRDRLLHYVDQRIDKLAEWTDSRDTVHEQKLQKWGDGWLAWCRNYETDKQCVMGWCDQEIDKENAAARAEMRKWVAEQLDALKCRCVTTAAPGPQPPRDAPDQVAGKTTAAAVQAENTQLRNRVISERRTTPAVSLRCWNRVRLLRR